MAGKSGQFEKLLGEINDASTQTDTLAKALSSGGEGGGAGGEGAGGEGGDAGAGGGAEGGDGKGEGGEGGEDLTKGFEVMGPDGKPVRVVDGMEMLKALGARLDGSEEVMEKAMSTAVGLIVKQGAMIGELTKQVKDQGVMLKAMSGEGRGRRTVLSMHEKPDATTLAKGGLGVAQGDTITAPEFMMKAEVAYNAKKISGAEFTEIDVALRTRQPVDPALLRKVVTATAGAAA